jgi:monofunctional biosynthetic peptidoglycan transglycosylase
VFIHQKDPMKNTIHTIISHPLSKKITKLCLALWVINLLYVILLSWVFPPFTITQLSNWMDGYGLERDYVDYEDISPEIRLAVMASEDQLFAIHGGFDWEQMKSAWENNHKPGSKTHIRGGSTITQQTAKNVFLWQKRSYIRKILEVYYTILIERIWGKERILEVYLNVTEMGPGIFGVEAAAQHYFHKPAKSLTRTEASLIAAILPSPKKYQIAPASSAMQKRSKMIRQHMKNLSGYAEIEELVHPEKQNTTSTTTSKQKKAAPSLKTTQSK